MAATEDGATLVVAESHANRLTAYGIDDDGWTNVEYGRPPGMTTPTGSASTSKALSGSPTSRSATA
jgi:sugar lactone lactonase YvrE